MTLQYGLRCVKVGDGARHLHYAGVCAVGEFEALAGHVQQLPRALFHGAGGVQGIEFLRTNMGTFCVKDVFAFVVGLNIDGIAARQECRDINFKKELEEVPCYFLRGAYNPSEITGGDKIIMGIMKKLMGDNNPELKDAIINGADYVDRSEIKYIVEALLKE